MATLFKNPPKKPFFQSGQYLSSTGPIIIGLKWISRLAPDDPSWTPKPPTETVPTADAQPIKTWG